MHNLMRIGLLVLAFLLVPPSPSMLMASSEGGHGGEAKGGEKKEAGKAENGAIILGPMTVNVLSNTGYRFLHLTLDVQCEDNASAERLTDADCKQDLIFYLSSKLAEDLLTSAGKMALRKELIELFNKFTGPGKVKNVYFTELVFQ